MTKRKTAWLCFCLFRSGLLHRCTTHSLAHSLTFVVPGLSSQVNVELAGFAGFRAGGGQGVQAGFRVNHRRALPLGGEDHHAIFHLGQRTFHSEGGASHKVQEPLFLGEAALDLVEVQDHRLPLEDGADGVGRRVLEGSGQEDDHVGLVLLPPRGGRRGVVVPVERGHGQGPRGGDMGLSPRGDATLKRACVRLSVETNVHGRCSMSLFQAKQRSAGTN
mmetsp:Transcript_5935/g.15384  ORF Transcript_5935/g.15384 Transcript_5935/m.15384 type:complete len:219 (-) Transcript_5935:6-662(-)